MMRLRSAAMTTTPATSLRSTAPRMASSMAEDDWDCCALAANGKAAAPPMKVMNSRRFIGPSSRLVREGETSQTQRRRYHGDAQHSTTVNARRAENLHRLLPTHDAT